MSRSNWLAPIVYKYKCINHSCLNIGVQNKWNTKAVLLIQFFLSIASLMAIATRNANPRWQRLVVENSWSHVKYDDKPPTSYRPEICLTMQLRWEKWKTGNIRQIIPDKQSNKQTTSFETKSCRIQTMITEISEIYIKVGLSMS